MTSVGVVDRSSLDVKSLGRKMMERWSEQNMRRDKGGGDSKRQESEVYERERERGRWMKRDKERSGAEQRKLYLAQGVDKHSLPLGSVLLFLKVVARWLAHR